MFETKATNFARLAIAKAVAPDNPSAFVGMKWGAAAKAAVVGMNSSDPGDLTSPAAAEFIEAVREQAVTGRIPFRSVPLECRVLTGNGATADWVGEGRAKPVKRLSFVGTTLRTRKVTAIAVATDEVLRHSNPSAENIVRADLTSAAVDAVEQKFLSDDAATDEAPAGALLGVSPMVADTVDRDRALGAFIETFAGDLSRAWWIARPDVFTRFSSFSHGTVGMRGGELLGAPAVASRNAPEHRLILVDPARVAVGMEGARVDVSRNAMIHMSDDIDASVNDGGSPPDVDGLPATDLVSLWQQNAAGFLTEMFTNWETLPGAISILDVEVLSLGGDSPGA